MPGACQTRGNPIKAAHALTNRGLPATTCHATSPELSATAWGTISFVTVSGLTTASLITDLYINCLGRRRSGILAVRTPPAPGKDCPRNHIQDHLTRRLASDIAIALTLKPKAVCQASQRAKNPGQAPPPHHIAKSLNHSLLGSRRGAILGVRHEVCTIAAGLGGRTWPSHAWARNWEHGSFRVSAYS